MKRRVGALLMALVLIMTGFAAYAEEGQPAELAVEDYSIEDASVPEEEPAEGEDAPYEEEPAAVSEEPAEVAEPETAPETSVNVEVVTEEQTTVPEETQSEAATEPETPVLDEETEEDIESYTKQSGSLSVTVEAPKGALPENVLLDMQIVDAGTDEYEEVQSYVQESGEEASNLEIADIYFTSDGEKVDPSEPVTVKLALTATNADTSSLKAWDYTDRMQGTLNADTQEVEFVTANLQTFAATWEDGNGTTATDEITSLDGENGSEGDSDSAFTINVIVTSNPEDGEAYRKGDELTYTIEAENTGDVDLYNIEVRDALTDTSWEIDSLSVGDSFTPEKEASYFVTTKDAEAKSLTIEGEAIGEYISDKSDLENPVMTTTDLVEYSEEIFEDGGGIPATYGITYFANEANPQLTLEISVSPGPYFGQAYREGDSFELAISVINSGDVDLSEIELKDDLTDNTLPLKDRSLIVGDNLGAGESYEVSEEDVKNGSIVFSFSATGICDLDKKDSEDGDPDEQEPVDIPVVLTGDLEVFTQIGPQLEVEIHETNNSANGYAYKVGKKIKYRVTVKNIGDVTVSDIQVTNTPVDDTEEESWTIPSLEQGESKGKTITYTVQDYDTFVEKYNDKPNISIYARAEGIGLTEFDPADAEDEITVDVEPSPQKFVDTDNENGDYNDDGKEIEVGDELFYLITYKNTETEAKTVTITDALEESVDFVKASKGYSTNDDRTIVTWTFENVQPQEEGHVKLRVKVNENSNLGVWNTANVKVGSNETITGVYNPRKDGKEQDPQKSVNVGDRTVSVGETLTYTISYYNHHAEYEAVTITDTLDKGLTYVDNSVSKGGKYDSGTITWEVEAEPLSWGEVTFMATVNGSTAESSYYSDEVFDDEDENSDGSAENSSSYSESVTTGEVENIASVKIGDDEEKETKPVTNKIYSTSSSSGSGSGSGGESSSKNTAVNTADDTPVAPMAVLFGSALAVLGADILYRRRRTQR